MSPSACLIQDFNVLHGNPRTLKSYSGFRAVYTYLYPSPLSTRVSLFGIIIKIKIAWFDRVFPGDQTGVHTQSWIDKIRPLREFRYDVLRGFQTAHTFRFFLAAEKILFLPVHYEFLCV